MVSICGLSEKAFLGCERSNKGSTTLQDIRFADAQVSRFHASKILNLGSALLLVCRSNNVQQFCFETTKRSDMRLYVLQGGLLANCHQQRIVAAEIFDEIRTNLQEGRFANPQETRLHVANR